MEKKVVEEGVVAGVTLDTGSGGADLMGVEEGFIREPSLETLLPLDGQGAGDPHILVGEVNTRL